MHFTYWQMSIAVFHYDQLAVKTANIQVVVVYGPINVADHLRHRNRRHRPEKKSHRRVCIFCAGGTDNAGALQNVFIQKQTVESVFHACV